MLNHLKSEARLLNGLQELDIPPVYYEDILSLKVHPTHTKYTLNMRSQTIMVSHVTSGHMIKIDFVLTTPTVFKRY